MLRKALTFIIGFLVSCQISGYAVEFFGPLLNFLDTDGKKWNLSALVVAPQSADSTNFTLSFEGSSETIAPELIDTVKEQNFWRYDMSLVREESEHKVTYKIGNKAYDIFVPAQHTDPHIFFGCCNEYAKPNSLWSRVNTVHEKTPYHVAFYAGDQIYNDPVFDLPSIKPVFSGTGKQIMDFQPTPAIEDDVTTFLLKYYQWHYSKPDFCSFAGSVPARNLSDDHEYFNGKGSYTQIPPILETVTKAADRFYFLFQHHTTKENASRAKLIGPENTNSYSFLATFENSAFYGLDTRSERTPTQIASPASRQFMFDRLNDLTQPNIFVITGLPLVYQNLHLIEGGVRLFGYTDSAKAFMEAINGSVPWFANLDMTTDFVDQWTHLNHVQERNEIIQNLDKLVSKGKTITLLGGDAHSAGAGEIVDLFSSVRMRQLTSSALTSSPTPAIAVKFKEFSRKLQNPESFGNNLIQRLTSLKNMSSGNNEKSMDLNLNNWLDINLAKGGIYPVFFVVPNSQNPHSTALETWLPTGWTYPKGDTTFTVN